MESQLSPQEAPRIRRTPLWKIWTCYVTAFLFTVLILASLIGAAGSLLPESWAEHFSIWDLFEFAGLGFLIVFFTRFIGGMWRSRSEDLKLGFTDFPNPFFDENFIQAPHFLRDEIEEMRGHLAEAIAEGKRAEKIVRSLNRHALEKEQVIEELSKKLTVLIRHHENASRLLGSAAYLSYMGDVWRSEMLNNILSECLTCLEKDQSDKSVSLFRVYGDELRIEHYIRISAASARKMRLKKGEGFAGMVWDIGESQYLPDISANPSFAGQLKPNDEYSSIVGVPIRINGEVLGVLCVQSEVLDGFSKQDLRTLRFYAHACSLIFVYDIMNSKMGSAEGVAQA
ncbi:GAF domain-containing protein (plasmid) [Paenibacillus rhizovicinus]|uniref:GAF domain-containing protein n=1 Tax=Paenibacillus rhizovicinus TaxID=2704463 RepID=A0A6C0PAN2_9BACL|nr:GAF domain-containing protein [Paenibacillus rhizovicinus]QHW35549.1 GAF domain-containing protein [Paenibacillus rhizovicinus]